MNGALLGPSLAAGGLARLTGALSYRKNAPVLAWALPLGTPGCNPWHGFLICLWGGHGKSAHERLFDVL